MEGAGLNSEVLAGGKKFHIQTNFLEPIEKIVSNIFDNGKVIYKKELSIENEPSDKPIKELIGSVHKEMVTEIELLFYVADKVHTIRHAISNNKLGIVFYQKNLYDEAIKEFKTAIEIDPDYVDAYKNLSFLLLKNKELNQASDILNTCLAKHPDFPDLHNIQGCVFLGKKDHMSAISEFNIALRINPKYAEAHFNLGLCLLKSIVDHVSDERLADVQERKDMAIGHLQQAESFVKSDHLIEAYEHFDKDDIDKAVTILDRVQKESYETLEDDFESEFYLKFMFGGKGKDDAFVSEYIDRLKKVIQKNPNYSDLRNNLGTAYLIQCRNLFLKALDEFRQAIKINPNFKKAKKNLKLAENDGKGFLILLRAILK